MASGGVASWGCRLTRDVASLEGVWSPWRGHTLIGCVDVCICIEMTVCVCVSVCMGLCLCT